MKLVDKNGYFEGYASVFNVKDEQNDIIVKGAFTKSIQQYARLKKFPNMYFNHDPSIPIGTWMRMEEDDYGLYVVGKLLFIMPMAQAVEAMMHRMSVGLSVGINITSSQIQNGIRNICEVDLREISVTRQPANHKARCFVPECGARI